MRDKPGNPQSSLSPPPIPKETSVSKSSKLGRNHYLGYNSQQAFKKQGKDNRSQLKTAESMPIDKQALMKHNFFTDAHDQNKRQELQARNMKS